MQTKSPLLTLAAALLVTACGNSVGSKEDAAAAAAASKKAAESATSASGSTADPLLAGGFEVGHSSTVTGKSGTAEVKLTASTGATDTKTTYQIVFKNYSADGETTLDGNMTYTTEVNTSLDGVKTLVKQTGKWQQTGEYTASMDVDLEMSVSAGASGVSMKLTGYVTADGTKYDYTDFAFSVAAD